MSQNNKAHVIERFFTGVEVKGTRPIFYWMATFVFLFFHSILVVEAAPKNSAKPSKIEWVMPTGADPAIGKHLFRYYCAVCHGLSGKGNGPNAENLDPHPADLTGEEVEGLSDVEIYEVIEKGGAGVDISGYMPPWGKTLSSDQIAGLVLFIRQMQEGATAGPIRLADIRKSGKENCGICHIEGKEIKKVAPNLGHEGSKFNTAWLYQFLKDPSRVRPLGFIPGTKTRMPNFYFSNEDLSAVVAFLSSQKDDGIRPTELAHLSKEASEIEAGRGLFFDKYACDGCHTTEVDGKGGKVGPDLSKVAGRLKPEWVAYWLKRPQAIYPESPMPTFGISEGEIRSLMAFIFSLGQVEEAVVDFGLSGEGDPILIQKGEAIVKGKNCGFCHTIDRFNSQVNTVSDEKEGKAVAVSSHGKVKTKRK